jgi:hypothetical protein
VRVDVCVGVDVVVCVVDVVTVAKLVGVLLSVLVGLRLKVEVGEVVCKGLSEFVRVCVCVLVINNVELIVNDRVFDSVNEDEIVGVGVSVNEE